MTTNLPLSFLPQRNCGSLQEQSSWAISSDGPVCDLHLEIPWQKEVAHTLEDCMTDYGFLNDPPVQEFLPQRLQSRLQGPHQKASLDIPTHCSFDLRAELLRLRQARVA